MLKLKTKLRFFAGYPAIATSGTAQLLLLAVAIIAIPHALHAQFEYPQDSYWGADCGCDGSVCGGCDECLDVPTAWSGTTEFLWLSRTKPDSQPLVERPFNGPPFTPLLNANQMTFEIASGVRSSLARDFGPNQTIDFTYLGVYDQDANATRTLDDGDGNPANDPFIRNFDAPVGSSTSYAAAYTSDLHSFDLSVYLARQWRIRPQVGLRWYRLSERLSLLDFVDQSHEAITRVNNDLVGGQLGLRGRIWDRGGWFYVDAAAKGGVYHNIMSLKSQTLGAAVQPIDRALKTTSLAGEFDITAVWQISDNFSVRFGYLGIFLNRVLLASDQLSRFQTGSGQGTPDLNYINFQGGHFGLNMTW